MHNNNDNQKRSCQRKIWHKSPMLTAITAELIIQIKTCTRFGMWINKYSATGKTIVTNHTYSSMSIHQRSVPSKLRHMYISETGIEPWFPKLLNRLRVYFLLCPTINVTQIFFIPNVLYPQCQFLSTSGHWHDVKFQPWFISSLYLIIFCVISDSDIQIVRYLKM